MDAHHITNRDSMPNGGYVKENGISLCSECHMNAELEYFGVVHDPEYSIEKLYELIGLYEELAIRASERLSKGCLETIAQSFIVLFQWVTYEEGQKLTNYRIGGVFKWAHDKITEV